MGKRRRETASVATCGKRTRDLFATCDHAVLAEQPVENIRLRGLDPRLVPPPLVEEGKKRIELGRGMPA